MNFDDPLWNHVKSIGFVGVDFFSAQRYRPPRGRPKDEKEELGQHGHSEGVWCPGQETNWRPLFFCLHIFAKRLTP